MASNEIVIHCLPGLGADRRLFADQMAGVAGVVCPALPPPGECKGISDYAELWAKGVTLAGPTLFIGFSFGGMVALEGLPHLKENVLGLIILSGTRSQKGITADFKRKVSLMHLAPKPLLHSQLRRMSRIFSPNDDLTDGQRELLISMADEADLDFLRWAAAACSRWTYPGPEEAGFPYPLFQIHGERDDTIPMVEGEPDWVVPGGGHLLQYSRAAEINRLIEMKRDEWLGA